MAQTSSKVTNPPKKLTFQQLEKYWIDAGGPKALAPVMAAIALAESSGNLTASHRNNNGTTDKGPWQINSVHSKYKNWNLYDPAQNAKAAVEIYHSQGLGAWTTFKTGAYLKPLKQNTSKHESAQAQFQAALKNNERNPPKTGAEKVIDGATSAITEPISNIGSGIESAVLLGLKEGMYALAILGGGMLILLGLLFIGVDVGLSSLSRRAGNHPAVRLANAGTTRVTNRAGKASAKPEDSGGGNLPGPDA